MQGGISSGYKKYIAENNLNDDTYTSDVIALFRVSGTSVHNNKTVQVDAVSFEVSSTSPFYNIADALIRVLLLLSHETLHKEFIRSV